MLGLVAGSSASRSAWESAKCEVESNDSSAKAANMSASSTPDELSNTGVNGSSEKLSLAPLSPSRRAISASGMSKFKLSSLLDADRAKVLIAFVECKRVSLDKKGKGDEIEAIVDDIEIAG